MATDDLGGFLCPDDNTPIVPHGGVLDVKKKQLVFWASCPVCLKAGRSPKVVARVDLDWSTFCAAKQDGLVWVVISGSAA